MLLLNSDRHIQPRGCASNHTGVPRKEHPRGVCEAGSGSKAEVPRGMAEEREGEGRGKLHTEQPLRRSGVGQCLFVSLSITRSSALPLFLPFPSFLTDLQYPHRTRIRPNR